MKYTEAKNIVKNIAPVKYRGTKLIILQRLTDGLFHGVEDKQDIEGREVRKKTATILGWVKLKNPTYLMDVLRGIKEITAERHGKYLKYTMDLSSLEGIKAPDQEQDIKEFKKKNATRMRKAYAAKCEAKEEEGRKCTVRMFLNETATSLATSVETLNFVTRLLQEVK